MATWKIKQPLYEADGSAITGSSSLTIKIKRDADDYLFDFADSTFKASGWTDNSEQLAEFDAVNLPGEYEKEIDISSWNDGFYTIYITYSGSPVWHDTTEVYIAGGNIATSVEGLLQTVIDGTVTVEKLLQLMLATIAGAVSRSSNTYTYKDQAGADILEDSITEDAATRVIS